MRNTLKASTLENRFPLLAVENNYIVSKNADITAAFSVELPEIFTLSPSEYSTLHLLWIKAMKVLPAYSIIHKQDWFLKENYTPDFEKESSFLSRSFQLHLNERPFLNHYCYLFLTKTTKAQSRMQSNFSTLCRNFIVPKEVSTETFLRFAESVDQFERILNDSGMIKISRLSDDEIIGTQQRSGIIEKYLSLSQDDQCMLEDITITANELKIGDKRVCLHTLSDPEDLPGTVDSTIRYQPFSTENTDYKLSFSAPVGLLLSCNHIYNQYVMIDDPSECLKRFERTAKNMKSLAKYSRANNVNREWIELYLNEVHAKGQTPVRAHFNVFAWSDNSEELKKVKNEIGSQIAMLECRPHHNTTDVPFVYWAGMPGNAGDFPAEETFFTFPEQAFCFFNQETNYRNSPSPFGIKLTDRLSGKPIHVDISDLPMRKGLISNRNKFILGGSGSGKSFFTNHMVRQYWLQGSHVMLVDVGNSYLGLCTLINEMTGGKDGIYYTYTEDQPISFNPFYVEDGSFDIEKKESIKTLLLTLWKKDTEPINRSEEVCVSNAINLYIQKIRENSGIQPGFNSFYEFVRDEYPTVLQESNVREKDFDINNFLNVLSIYYAGGEYDYLLNSQANIDLLHKRFVVFELDNVKDHPIIFPVVTLIIMENFISKMRKLKGQRKTFLVEEAWKAIAKNGMAEFIKYLFKTARKHFGEIVIITQEIDDIISSTVVKESIINNSDCKILLDQRKYANKFEVIQRLLGLSEKEKTQILSINLANNPQRSYKEVFISLGGLKSTVFATEVSRAEYLTYTTEESEKTKVLALADELGSMRQAIRQLALQTA